ncbi:MAG: outer membrane protein assembly factor BamE [Polaromonas sp.]|nr:outer membrane protein assembly factor BamE [Polaromonas sp.]
MINHIATPYPMSANHRYSIRSALKVSALAASASLVLTACGSFSGTSSSAINPANWLTPYRTDVIQGNFVSKEQIEALRAGMPRAQVKDLLGTPLITSLFHADRWDYVFTLKRQGVEPQSYRYAVFFKGDLLDRFEGDTMPSEAEFISRLDNKRKLGKVPLLQATEEQLKAAEKSTARPAALAGMSAATVPADPQTTVYPPLESARP